MNASESYVKGWFVLGGGDGYKLWLALNGERVPVFTRLTRPDVAHHHRNDPAFKYSGFLARFHRPKLTSTAKLIVETSTGETALVEDIPVPGADEAISLSSETIQNVSLTHEPLISVLLAVPDTHIYFITRSVESVLQQSYPKWQLCIAYESSEPSPITDYLERIAAKEPRVRFTPTDTESLTELSNRALQMAKGEFLLRLDYRDELHPEALAEIANAVQEKPSLDVVYANEDEMDFYGHCTRPVHKPAFDAEAFLHWNFIGNMWAVRREALVRAGGYSANAQAIDDWDVLLRVLDLCEHPRVHHIAKALYHFRKGDDAAAPLPREANTNRAQALADHLTRVSVKATIEPGLFPGSFRLRRNDVAGRKIAVIVRPEDGAFQHAAVCANSDPEMARVYELVGSSLDPLSDHLPRKIIRSMSEMDEDIFIFVNRPLDSLNHLFCEELADQAMRPDCGVVTGVSLDRAGRILHSGFRQSGDEKADEFAGISFINTQPPRDVRVVRSLESISDEFFAVKRTQLEALGGLQIFASADMPKFVERLVEASRSQNLRVLVTPYAVATLDVDSPSHSVVAQVSNTEEFMPADEPLPNGVAAESDRKLAAQVREIATERNKLRREVSFLQDTIAELRAKASIQAPDERLRMERQIAHLNAALDAERRVNVAIQNSLSWKLTKPFRACMRLFRRKV